MENDKSDTPCTVKMPIKGQGLFITGTDTDVGKTFITALLGGLFQEAGYQMGMVKPVASGAIIEPDHSMHSGDADELMRLTGINEERRLEVNPLCLKGAYSPKVAARLENRTIPIKQILTDTKAVIERYDITLVEGAGGITTPLTEEWTFTNFASHLGCPALLISDGRLGAVNRAVLTAYYARMHNIHLIGFIVNDMDRTEPFLLQSNCSEIASYTGLPLLATVPAYTGSRSVKDELAWARQYIDPKKILHAAF